MSETRRGSPPRVRGKVQAVLGAGGDEGITPARAGKRPAATSSRTPNRDHPRACGEKVSSSSPEKSRPGSPPRVRGKGSYCHLSAPPQRITPARAGKSHRPGIGAPQAEDHPRACGEKSSFATNS